MSCSACCWLRLSWGCGFTSVEESPLRSAICESVPRGTFEIEFQFQVRSIAMVQPPDKAFNRKGRREIAENAGKALLLGGVLVQFLQCGKHLLTVLIGINVGIDSSDLAFGINEECVARGEFHNCQVGK
jgi:hypothetical protein